MPGNAGDTQQQPSDNDDAAPANRMPTSELLELLDPARKPLRDAAIVFFEDGDYAAYREWTAAARPLWHNSPTGCFLSGISMVYEAEELNSEDTKARRSELLRDAEALIQQSRKGWNALLSSVDRIEGEQLNPDDPILLETSVQLVSAWIQRLRGFAERAEALIRERLDVVLDIARRERPRSIAKLSSCSYYYLLYFASRDGDVARIRKIFDEIWKHIPDGARHPDFEDVSEAVRTRACFASAKQELDSRLRATAVPCDTSDEQDAEARNDQIGEDEVMQMQHC